MRQPSMDRKVENHHTLEGRILKYNHSKSPDNTGALPIAITVPIATPVMETAEKNNGWYAAILKEANIVVLIGQFLWSNFPIITTIINKKIPPTAKRVAPIAIGCAVSGANAWAVPVVPQSIAANNIKNGDNFSFMLLTSNNKKDIQTWLGEFIRNPLYQISYPFRSFLSYPKIDFNSN